MNPTLPSCLGFGVNGQYLNLPFVITIIIEKDF